MLGWLGRGLWDSIAFALSGLGSSYMAAIAVDVLEDSLVRWLIYCVSDLYSLLYTIELFDYMGGLRRLSSNVGA